MDWSVRPVAFPAMGADRERIFRMVVRDDGATGAGVSVQAADVVQQQIAADRVRMLYAQAPAAILISVAAAIALVLSGAHEGAAAHYKPWAAVMMALLLLRALLYGVFLRRDVLRQDAQGGEPSPDVVRRWERLYAVLVLLTGLHFALWPLLNFAEFGAISRLTVALTLGAMAGAAIAVLSILRWLALSYGALLLLPTSSLLLVYGGLDERVCGALGWIYWLMMLFAVSRTHAGLKRALELSHRHVEMVERMDRQSQALVEANRELADAQRETQRTNQVLEQRILERTAELHRLATRDSLTGLANRARLIEIAEHHLLSNAAPLALYFVDLDGFKEINDSMGHAVGDAVLSEVARRLATIATPDADAGGTIALARWGGDEFLLLRRRDSGDAADIAFAECLVEVLRDPVQNQPYSVRVDACVGIAHWPEDGQELQELIYGADMAVYAAKAAGRGKVRVYGDALAEVGRRRSAIRKALALTLSEGCVGLELVYQPVFAVPQRRLVSAEALLRWRHDDLGVVGPGEFIPVAENTGDIIALGDWVLHEACRFAAGLQADALPTVSVNVSVHQLLYPDFVAQVRAVLADTGLAPQRLVLELTESVFIHDQENIAPVFSALAALGLQLSIDDFGTGYSSLAYLQRVPAAQLKVDGSFVADLEGGGGPIVEASISLARAFGLKVVAEGVETEGQLRALEALGVDRVQGFLLARPESAAALQARAAAGV